MFYDKFDTAYTPEYSPISNCCIIGSIISAGASLLGSALGAGASKDASEMNAAAQKEFAQHGIRWKVEDAKQAGVHPLYALGANTHSFAPSYVGSHMGDGIAAAGQDIGRAIDAKQTETERLQNDLLREQIRGTKIDNDLRASQHRLVNQAGQPPAMPDVNREPSGYTAARTDLPWMEAAPSSPGGKEFEYPYMGTVVLPSERAKDSIEDVLPYELEHYAAHRILPALDKYIVQKPREFGRAARRAWDGTWWNPANW